MLQPILHILNSKKIILASGSPRRKLILENIGLTFTVISSTFEESLDKSSFSGPQYYALETAEQKVKEVAARLDQQGEEADIIIGADTVVAYDGCIYEKPRDKDHAFEILSKFSGNTHSVHTGVVLMTRNHGSVEPYDVSRFTETTEVVLSKLTSAVIKSYIETGEPMDKAGGYGIQGEGGSIVQEIHGDYYNVMGFPLHAFCKRLVEIYKNKYPDIAKFY